MKELVFLVQGREEAPYTVRFMKTDFGVSASCTCKAASNGMSCKHRLEIMCGNDPGVVTDNRKDIRIVKQWFDGSSLQQLLFKIRELEEGVDLAQKEIRRLKSKFAEFLVAS